MSTPAPLPLPLTVTVAESGSVLIEAPERTIGMSRFSTRARKLATDFGVGEHVVTDESTLFALTRDDLAEALS